MKNKDGQIIRSCGHGAPDTIGNCASCMFCRNWVNTRSLHEGDPDYCDCSDVVVESEVKP